MAVTLIVILGGPLVIILLFLYRTKNVRQTEQAIQAQPTLNADFESTVRRWYQFTWNLVKVLRDYNSFRNKGGRLTLVNNELLLKDAQNQEIFRLPVANLRIERIGIPGRSMSIWVYDNQSNRYHLFLLVSRNLLKQVEPYTELEQALIKVRGQGYSTRT